MPSCLHNNHLELFFSEELNLGTFSPHNPLGNSFDPQVSFWSAPWTLVLTVFSGAWNHRLVSVPWPMVLFPTVLLQPLAFFLSLINHHIFLFYTQTHAPLSIYNYCPQRSSCRKICAVWHIKEERLMLPPRKLSIPISGLARGFSVQQNRVSPPLPGCLWPQKPSVKCVYRC